MTWKQVAYRAFRLAQVNKMAGRDVNTFEDADALVALNAMLDAWNGERLFIPRVARLTFPLEAGKPSYSLGPDGDWNAVRPLRLEHAGIIVDGTETPIDVLITADQWAEVSRKSDSSEPCAVYVDPEPAALRLWFYPVPSTAYDVALYAWDQLLKIGALDETAVFPPGGYENAIVYNLALEIAAQWPDNRISPITISRAGEYKATVKRLNIKPVLMKSDVPGVCGGRYDILTGGYR